MFLLCINKLISFRKCIKHLLNLGTNCFCGVLVIMLAIGPKVRGLKPGQGRWIFKGDKNPLYDLLRREVQPSVSCRNILRHVKDPYSMKEILEAKFMDISLPVSLASLLKSVQRSVETTYLALPRVF
jgi:hypothetical protein